MKIIILTQMLCVCITLAKTIYKPTNSTNPAQLLSTQAKDIHTRRNRDTRHIQSYLPPVGGSSYPPRPDWWALNEIWPPSAQVYQWLNITADDIYRAINVYENDFDEWPICDTGADINEISTETTNCAAFNVVIESASIKSAEPAKPLFWPSEEIWPPTAREYEGLNITIDDINRAAIVHERGDWPMCRGISCETISCKTISCAAFNLVFDILLPHKPWDLWWPDEEIWPPRARVYDGINITVDDIYRATKVYRKGFDKWPICRGISCETISCATISCAAFNLVYDILPYDMPWDWPDEEIWPPRARVYDGINITVDDIYRATKVYRKGFDKWPICRSISYETISYATISCAAFNLVFDIIVPHDRPRWPREEIWPPRARVYEGINITLYDIYRAINVYSNGYRYRRFGKNGDWPICRGISCETISCKTISCAAFNLVFDIFLPHDRPSGWPDEDWPPRARVYEGLNITGDDIYRAINVYRKAFDKWPIYRDISCKTISCAAFNLVFDIIVPHNRPSGWPREEIWPPRALVYEGINTTLYDIIRATNDWDEAKNFPICRGIICETINCKTISCAAYNLFFDIKLPHYRPQYWPDEEIWPPRGRVYEGFNITGDDIYRARNVYAEGFDKWPIYRDISCKTISCAAFNLVFDIFYDQPQTNWYFDQPWYWPDEDFPPRARVYEGLNITEYDIYRAIHLYVHEIWPICRGISCETINCSTINCAAFNLVYDYKSHTHYKPGYWPYKEIWPPRARVYKGLNITVDDIYIAIDDIIRDDEGLMCTGPDAETTRCAARNLLEQEYKTHLPDDCSICAVVGPRPRPCGPCRLRKADKKCVWSRSTCKYRGRSRRRPNRRGRGSQVTSQG